MALVTPQDILRTGLAPVYTLPTVSDTFQNDGRMFLHVKNAAGAPITVTITPVATIDSLAATARVVTIPATTGDKMLGPFAPELYNDSNTGLMTIAYSAVTSVTSAIIRLPKL